jgi:hypothetical protein
MGIVAPILALLIRRHGISIVEIGVLGIAGMLGWLIFEPLSGIVSSSKQAGYDNLRTSLYLNNLLPLSVCDGFHSLSHPRLRPILLLLHVECPNMSAP